VRGASLEVGDKTDAARVVLEPRIIKTLLGGTANGGGAGRLDGGKRSVHDKIRRVEQGNVG
jgi:hypothetical protein